MPSHKAYPTHNELREQIASEEYHSFDGTTVTVCLLVMKNGIPVVGESVFVNEEDFSPVVARDVAQRDALNKVAKMEWYAAHRAD